MNTLGIILARNHPEQRLFDKNGLEISDGLTCCGRVIDIAHAAGCNDVIISTNDLDSFRTIAAKHGAHLVERKQYIHHVRHEPIVTEAILAYETENRKRFNEFVVLWGTAVFIRPSWIREAIRALREEEYVDRGITHVMPAERPPMVVCFRRMQTLPLHDNLVYMKHKGPIVDIDDEDDYHIARSIFENNEFSLDETYHNNKIDLTPDGTAAGIHRSLSPPRWLQVIYDLDKESQ